MRKSYIDLIISIFGEVCWQNRINIKKAPFIYTQKNLYMASDLDKLRNKGIDLVVESKMKQLHFDYLTKKICQSIKW